MQRIKNTQSKIKLIKIGKKPAITYCLGCKDFTHNFRPQDVKTTNKVLREKSNCVVCQSNKSRFLKQKQQQKIIQCFTNRCYKIMKTYCVKYRKDTENLNSKIFRRKNCRLILQSKCTDCGIKKSRFVREQKAKDLLNNLGIKKPLSKIPLLNVLL